MKTKAVVETIGAEVEHVLDMPGCHVVPEFDGDGALVGFDGCLGVGHGDLLIRVF